MVKLRLILGIPSIIMMYALAFFIPLEIWNILFKVYLSLFIIITLVVFVRYYIKNKDVMDD